MAKIIKTENTLLMKGSIAKARALGYTQRTMIVLGIETSCDETAAALVDKTRAVRGSRLLSQVDAHRLYGGVVPEIAARAHLDHLDALIEGARADSGIGWDQVDAIAATCGPGLIGGVMVGAMTGKALALALNKPFLAINHLEAHALTPRLTDDVDFPYLLLLISGGHCQLLVVEGIGKYKRYGTTLDDAVGEAFDKCAKLLGLGFPGGPLLEKAAARGDPNRFTLPQPLLGKPGCDFSFSGIKTAVRMLAEANQPLDEQDKCDIAASFQRTVFDSLIDRAERGLVQFKADYKYAHTLVAAGGVAANQALRKKLESLAHKHKMRLAVPPPALCTDNAVMVAWAGIEKLRLGLTDGLDAVVRPRWPLC
jgi:N6-L-threonylcarbamoyladenine synthase